MLVNFFLCHCYGCLVAQQGFGNVTENWGSQPPTDFYGFHLKNTHLSTLFMEKGRTVPAVSAVSNIQYKNILVSLPTSLGRPKSKSRSLAKIYERRMQFY